MFLILMESMSKIIRKVRKLNSNNQLLVSIPLNKGIEGGDYVLITKIEFNMTGGFENSHVI